MTASTTLCDPQRLTAVRQVRNLDPARRQIMTRLAVLAAELCDAPVALITIVDDQRQVFAAQWGLPEELAQRGETPIDYSMCQFAVSTGKPLIVDSMADDPEFRTHPAFLELGVAAYAGIPLVTSEGHALGALCVIDFVPRDWSDDVLARLALLAEVVTDEFELQSHERAEAFRRTWRAIPDTRPW